jgi:hypothetical protein
MSFIRQITNAIAPTSIDSLKSTISKRSGAARPNRFAIFMTPPSSTFLNLDLQGAASSFLSGGFSLGSLVNDPRDISMLCESCSLPSREITTLDYQTFRQSIKLPNGYNVSDIDFTFLLTNDYYVRKMFDKWINSIVDVESYGMSYRNEYTTDVVIQQLNEQNVPVYGVKLMNAYPIAVQSVELNQTSESTIQKQTVTFTFEDFKPEGAITSAITGIGTSIGGFTRII